jgi:hypothetical protein
VNIFKLSIGGVGCDGIGSNDDAAGVDAIGEETKLFIVSELIILFIEIFKIDHYKNYYYYYIHLKMTITIILMNISLKDYIILRRSNTIPTT